MRSWRIPTAIIVGGIIVAGAIYSMAPPAPRTDPSRVRPVSAADHILGNPSAPVAIVEYADFACTYCQGFHAILHQIVANEGAMGRVAWVFRHFPLDETTDSLALAKASECAADIEGPQTFWSFADALFEKQPVKANDIGSVAASVGITGNAFATCYSTASSTLDARIATDRQNALDMGAQGVPFTVILARGKDPIVLESAYSYDAVKQLISQVLSQ